MDSLVLIVYGDPYNGFSCVGPVATNSREAEEVTQQLRGGYWWYVPVTSAQQYLAGLGVSLPADPAGDVDDRPGVTFTHGQLETWAGRALSYDEVRWLEQVLPASTLPEVVGTVVASHLGEED